MHIYNDNYFIIPISICVNIHLHNLFCCILFYNCPKLIIFLFFFLSGNFFPIQMFLPNLQWLCNFFFAINIANSTMTNKENKIEPQSKNPILTPKSKRPPLSNTNACTKPPVNMSSFRTAEFWGRGYFLTEGENKRI